MNNGEGANIRGKLIDERIFGKIFISSVVTFSCILNLSAAFEDGSMNTSNIGSNTSQFDEATVFQMRANA